MSKINVLENKSLKLNNVLSRQVSENDVFVSAKHITMLNNYLKSNNLKSVGPVIFYSSGVVGVSSDGTAKIKNKLMIQLERGDIKVEYPYVLEQNIRLANCLYVKFKDEYKYFSYATSAIALHSYNNDIDLTSEVYIINLSNSKESFEADVFMPIK